MNRQTSYILTLLLTAVVITGCGSRTAINTGEAGTAARGIVVPPISHNDSLRFKIYYFEAVKQQVAGNYDAAYDLLSHCLEINPNAAEAYFMMSSYSGVLNGDTAALEDVKKAAELDPENNAYLERLGTGYIRIGNIDEAIKAYEKLAHNSPERSDVLDILNQLYIGKKDYDNVIKTIERIEALEGSSEQTALSKMQVYSLQGKKEEEFNELKSMSEKYPNDMNYRVMMGNWLLQNGKPDDAYRQYMDVLGQEPENPMARMSMIDYYKTVGDKAKADSIQETMLVNPKTPVSTKMILMRQVVADNEKNGGDSTQVLSLFKRILKQPQETSDMAELYAAYMTLKKMPQDSITKVLETVLAISPDNAAARLQLIQTMWNEKDFDKVIELSRQALDYNPDEMAFYYFLGLAYVQKDDDDNALDVFRKGVSQIDDESNPDIVSDFYAIMGDILYSKGQELEAYAAYDSCLQWKDDNFGCLNNYAYYLSETGKNLDKAEQMSYRTVQAEPDNSTYLDTYAWILFKQKKYKDAQPYIDMAIKNDTTSSAVLLEHAGDIHIMNGETDKALEYWREALENSDGENKVLIRKIKLKKYVEK